MLCLGRTRTIARLRHGPVVAGLPTGPQRRGCALAATSDRSVVASPPTVPLGRSPDRATVGESRRVVAGLPTVPPVRPKVSPRPLVRAQCQSCCCRSPDGATCPVGVAEAAKLLVRFASPRSAHAACILCPESRRNRRCNHRTYG